MLLKLDLSQMIVYKANQAILKTCQREKVEEILDMQVDQDGSFMHHSSRTITFEASGPKFKEASVIELQEQGQVFITQDHLVL